MIKLFVKCIFINEINYIIRIMKNKYILTLIAFILITSLFAQTNLNDYKYVIIPKKFDFLKEADQYQVNSLTKFLLEKEKFQTFFDDLEFPDDLTKNRCLALTANVLNESGMLKTKLKVQLQDCRNNIVFESRIGDSKLKDFKKAYHEAIREAFESFKTMNYSYNPKVIDKKEIVNAAAIEEPKIEQIPVPEKVEKIVEVKTISEQAIPIPVSPEIPEKAKDDIKPVSEQIIKSDILYAQAIQGGFQLVDKTPKVVYTIFQSGKNGVFIVKGKDAIIYQLNDIWVIAEQKGDDLEVNSINIKF